MPRQEPATTRLRNTAGGDPLQDAVETLLGFEDETFIAQLVRLAGIKDSPYTTQEGPRVVYREPIKVRLAHIMRDDAELFEGVFLPAIRADRRYNVPSLLASLHTTLNGQAGPYARPQTARDLLAQQFPPLRFFVEEILAEGFTILAGKPKKGKSYLALDMSLAIAVGRQAFGHFDTTQAQVLYISLEDGPRRLQRRLWQIQPNLVSPPGLSFLYQFPRLGEGALEALAHYAQIYKIIIIDIIGRLLPRQTEARKSLSEYQELTDTLGPIQRLAQEQGLAIIVIDHVRKASAEDAGDAIMGSQGKFGVADHALIYERKGEEKDAVLRIISRDIDEQKFILTMNQGHLDFLGKGELYELDSEHNRVIKILEEERRPMDVTALMKAMGIHEAHYPRFRQVLQRLYSEDRIGRTKRGQFTLYSQDWERDGAY